MTMTDRINLDDAAIAKVFGDEEFAAALARLGNANRDAVKAGMRLRARWSLRFGLWPRKARRPDTDGS